MIDSLLTDEQKAKFPEYVKRWALIGVNTEPTDKARAEEAIHKAYQCGGLEPPKEIIWSGSPRSQRILIGEREDALNLTLNSVECQMFGYFRFSSDDISLLESVGKSLSISVGYSVRDSVASLVWRSVRDSIGGRVRSVVMPVWSAIADSLDKEVAPEQYHILRVIQGNHNAELLSSYSYLREELGYILETEPLTGLMDLAEHCGWIAPSKDVCFASERHTGISRLNKTLKIEYPDGWVVSFPDVEARKNDGITGKITDTVTDTVLESFFHSRTLIL